MNKTSSILVFVLGLSCSLVLGQDNSSAPVHLAVTPKCGLLGAKVSDVNAGLDPSKFRTIVSFGDSFTDAGLDDGSPPLPAVLEPPEPKAGLRSANGAVWAEDVANATGATILSYAQWAACTDLSLWPSNPRDVDFIGQMKTFTSQEHELDPETTLYSMFFGINDWGNSKKDGEHLMQNASQVVLDQIRILSEPPHNGKSFLVLDAYGRGDHDDPGEAWIQALYDGLTEFRYGPKHLNVAFVNFATIWDAVLHEPGYETFGFVSTDACADCKDSENSEDCDQYGWCKDPDHYSSWFGGHPSKETHRLMAAYVLEVLKTCIAP